VDEFLFELPESNFPLTSTPTKPYMLASTPNAKSPKGGFFDTPTRQVKTPFTKRLSLSNTPPDKRQDSRSHNEHDSSDTKWEPGQKTDSSTSMNSSEDSVKSQSETIFGDLKFGIERKIPKKKFVRDEKVTTKDLEEKKRYFEEVDRYNLDVVEG